MTDQTPTIGHNSPPAEIELMTALESYFEEGKNFLDGSPIENDGQEEAVASIQSAAKEIEKRANALRVEEKRPHDDAAKAVQAKWKPIIDKADMLAKAAAKALTPYRNAKLAAQQEEARKAREEAEAKQLVALQAKQAADSLGDAEKAEALIAEADAAKKAAAKAKPKGATGLRTYRTFEITDNAKALAWIRERRPADLIAAMEEIIAVQVRSGIASIDGVTISEEKRAV